VYRCCALSSLALSLLILAPPAARADDAITPPTIDISRNIRQPVYREGARDKKEEGNTVLAIYVETSGRPSKINVDTTSGFDDLDQTAVAGARQWRFVPASDGRNHVPGWMKATIHFQLSALPSVAISENDVYALADIEDMIVCRIPAPPVGSNIMPNRVCATKRVWDAAAEQNKRRDNGMPRRTMQSLPGSPGGQ